MNIFLVFVVTTLYLLHFFSVSPSKESAVVKQKLSQEEEEKFNVTICPNFYVSFVYLHVKKEMD
jgi:hypothetical protein